ncbi:hypothetical protein UFOVP121_12 [uncultured Caudovirales phage]|uniref:Uncharacterized protein n=1 Tax=uncultured Caudovirales phage TaxID=2100421 RepID=A0A6J5LKS3_9CAUD|nr:hypothetical protein UFOVP121_12 [uncultured Caudovirales phage]CAB4134805.1 hypothetical protein UFOVP277_17 [uncultured Caudovirales phage]
MKILLGTLKNDADSPASGENLYLEKHKWDCGWYWGMGYIGNNRCHFHFESILKNNALASEMFETTRITDSEWWVIRDLFKQAYALRAAAEVYLYGGHQTSSKGITDILQNAAKARQINDDLERILNLVWDYTCEAIHK